MPIIDLPFKGAKGGLTCDPASMSRPELPSDTRRLAKKIAMALGVYRDIVAPDAGANGQVMA